MTYKRICWTCHGTGFVSSYDGCPRADKCPTCGGVGKVEVVMTNEDHLRMISTEELAVSRIHYDDYIGAYFGDFDCDGYGLDREDAIKAELAWLKQPYKED